MYTTKYWARQGIPVPAYAYKGGCGERNARAERRFRKPFPAVNITESADHYTLYLVAPGRKKDSFKVAVINGHLVISSTPQQIDETADRRFMLMEYQLAPFKRSFPLSEKADVTRISARYTDGVLVVHVPKKESAVETPEVEVEIA